MGNNALQTPMWPHLIRQTTFASFRLVTTLEILTLPGRPLALRSSWVVLCPMLLTQPPRQNVTWPSSGVHLGVFGLQNCKTQALGMG